MEKLGRKSRKFDKNRQKETSLFKILCYNGDNHYKGEDGKMLYLKKKFSFFSLRNRLILLFTGAMFCGMTLLGGMLFFYMYNSMKDNISSNIDTTVSAMTDSLDQSFVLIENTVLELAASSGVRSWIEDEDYYNKENPEFYIRREALNKEFQRILMYSNAKKLNMIEYASIFDNGELLGYTDIQSNGETTIINESRKVYDTLSEREEEYVYSIPIVSGRNTIFHVRRLKADFESDRQLGILIATKETDIKKKYQDLLEYEGSMVYITDQNGMIYSSNREELLGTYLDSSVAEGVREKQQEIEQEGETYLVVAKPLKETGMNFIYFYPKKLLSEKVFGGMRSYLLLNIVLIAAFLWIAFLLSIRSAEFLNELVCAMKSAKEKNYEIKMRKYNDVEIDMLGDAFNEMTTEIKELIQNKYQSQLLLNEMEINFLQHQMNPHFLFNVLLTIQIKAKRSSDECIVNMVSALSSLLRASIQTSDRRIITIGEELKYTEFYLYLQKMRFEDKLSYVIEVEDEEIKQYRIPKFVIEPIAENAVIHGIETMDEDAVVAIRICRDGGDLLISVTDNGVGFDVLQYQRESEEKEHDKPVREKVGLKNVNIRLKYIYGEKYGLVVKSQINKGTIVQIRIPMIEEEQVCIG